MPFDKRAYTWRGDYSMPQPNRGPLAGLRLVVKDLFHIAGLPTGAGNPDWLISHARPQWTSPVVEQLLAAGTRLIGKTLSDELAYSLNGLNIHYGAPLNPCCPDRLPGGSSTGSAVAVAAGEADIGLGTDTGGSIRVPASYNGLFGIRPTHGLVSTEHLVPLAPRFDTVGWMTANAELLARVGEVLLPEKMPQRQSEGPIALKVMQPKIEGVELWGDTHEAWLKQQPQIHVVQRLPIGSDWLTAASQCFRVLQGRAIWRSHGDWITRQKPVFAPDIQQRLDWCKQLSKDDERRAQQEKLQFEREILGWFDGVEALLLPTTPGPAPLLSADTDWMARYRQQLMGLTAPAGLAGLPQLQMPVLTLEGAPAGLSLLGPGSSDKSLLQMARQINCQAEVGR